MVYWASNLYDNTDENSRKQLTYNRMVYVTTDDFVNFSDPTVWIDVDRRGGAGSGSIDVTVQKVGDTYYRIYKDENTMSLRQEKSTDLTAAIGGAGVKNYADALKGSAWSEVATNIGKGQANGYGKNLHFRRRSIAIQGQRWRCERLPVLPVRRPAELSSRSKPLCADGD